MASIQINPAEFETREQYLKGVGIVIDMEYEALRHGRSERKGAVCIRKTRRYIWQLNGQRSSKLEVAKHLAK